MHVVLTDRANARGPSLYGHCVRGQTTTGETTVADAVFNVEELERNASDLRRGFEAAEPFPHLVVDDLLRLSPSAASAFPDKITVSGSCSRTPEAVS